MKWNVFLRETGAKIVTVEGDDEGEVRTRIASVRGLRPDCIRVERVAERWIQACPKCGFRRPVAKPDHYARLYGKEAAARMLAEWKPPLCGACQADERADYYEGVAADWREKARRRRNAQNLRRNDV